MAIPSREITRSSSEKKGTDDKPTTTTGMDEESPENHQPLLSRSHHSPAIRFLGTSRQHGSRRNLFQRATSLQRIHEKTDDQSTGTANQQSQLLPRRTSTSHSSRRKLLSRRSSLGNIEGEIENRRRLLQRGQSEKGNLRPLISRISSLGNTEGDIENRRQLLKRGQSEIGNLHLSSSDDIRSIAPTISRVSSDRRLVMKRGQSEMGLQHASSSSSPSSISFGCKIRSIAPTISRVSSDRRLTRASSDRRLQMTRGSSVSKMFYRLKRNALQHGQDEDRTDSLMAEMLASSHHSAHTNHDSTSKLDGSSQGSLFLRTPSRRDLFGSSQSNSMRNMFNMPTATSASHRKVKFFDKDSDEGIRTEIFLYEGTTENEKVLVHDDRSEGEVLKSTKWLASCKLVPGSGIYKQAVDVVFEENKKKHSSQNRSNELSKDIEIIVSSDLRGLEEIYSPAVQHHRESIVRKVVAAYQANPKLAGQHRFARLASELSARSVQIAHMLALGDTKEAERCISGMAN